MGAKSTFARQDGALLADFSARLASAQALRRAKSAADAARAEADEAVRAAIRTRSEFLANMHHELRTPLNAIIGFSTMLRDEDAYHLPPAQRKSYAEFILQSADLLLSRIDMVLSVAALDSGEAAAAREVFDIAAALKAAADRAQVAAKAADVAIELKTAETSVMATGDAVRFGQALDHALRAALAGSPQGGKIIARAAMAEGRAVVAIRDFSAGVDPVLVERLCKSFSAAQLDLERGLAGAALGLAVARALVELQGGAFALESSRRRGTILRFSLPMEKPTETEEQ